MKKFIPLIVTLCFSLFLCIFESSNVFTKVLANPAASTNIEKVFYYGDRKIIKNSSRYSPVLDTSNKNYYRLITTSNWSVDKDQPPILTLNLKRPINVGKGSWGESDNYDIKQKDPNLSKQPDMVVYYTTDTVYVCIKPNTENVTYEYELEIPK